MNWSTEEQDAISTDKQYLAKVDPEIDQRETLQEQHERLTSQADIIGQDPELRQHYGWD